MIIIVYVIPDASVDKTAFPVKYDGIHDIQTVKMFLDIRFNLDSEILKSESRIMLSHYNESISHLVNFLPNIDTYLTEWIQWDNFKIRRYSSEIVTLIGSVDLNTKEVFRRRSFLEWDTLLNVTHGDDITYEIIFGDTRMFWQLSGDYVSISCDMKLNPGYII